MRRRTIGWLAAAIVAALAVAGCGSGGSDNRAPTLRIGIADAKPALPDGVEAVRITVSDVSVHAAGGDWVSLPLATTPYVIDLMQFQNGASTEIVPPTALAAGTYTQVRFGVASGTLVVDGVEYPLEVPSDKLRTDKSFDLLEGGAVDLTVDFDLSQSIVVTGNGKYQLKPVLHLVETSAAATVSGLLAPEAFSGQTGATVVVYLDEDASGTVSAGDVEYTRITAPAGVGNVPFAVYWLVPAEGYVVEVLVDVAGVPTVVYEEPLASGVMFPGADLLLNGGAPI